VLTVVRACRTLSLVTNINNEDTQMTRTTVMAWDEALNTPNLFKSLTLAQENAQIVESCYTWAAEQMKKVRGLRLPFKFSDHAHIACSFDNYMTGDDDECYCCPYELRDLIKKDSRFSALMYRNN